MGLSYTLVFIRESVLWSVCGGGCAAEEYAHMEYIERDAVQWWDDKKTVH